MVGLIERMVKEQEEEKKLKDDKTWIGKTWEQLDDWLKDKILKRIQLPRFRLFKKRFKNCQPKRRPRGGHKSSICPAFAALTDNEKRELITAA